MGKSITRWTHLALKNLVGCKKVPTQTLFHPFPIRNMTQREIAGWVVKSVFYSDRLTDQGVILLVHISNMSSFGSQPGSHLIGPYLLRVII